MHYSVGIIGCGTIGHELALAIDNGKVNNASLIALFDKEENALNSLTSKLENNSPAVFTDSSRFFSSACFKETNIILESASQDAIREFAKTIVGAGKSLLVMSVGAFSDMPLLSDLIRISTTRGSRIFVPTGALAGIDAIRSVRHMVDSIKLVTTKNPKSLVRPTPAAPTSA